MAQVIETPGGDRYVERREIVDRSTDSGAGWAVAVIVIIAVVVGAFVWARYRAPAAAPQSPGANINVTVPSSQGSSLPSGGTSGSSGSGGSAQTPQGGAPNSSAY